MSAPSTIFANLPELLRCLAEEVHSRRQLATLSLVNRTFHAAFAPVLHRELKFAGDAQLQAFGTGSFRHHNHVRALSVSQGIHPDEDRVHNLMLQILPKLPRLESFTQVTHSPPSWARQLTLTRYSGLPLAVATASILHESCPSIKAIHITFPPDMGERIGHSVFVQPEGWRLAERALYGQPNLTVFAGLEELTLENLYEELPWWRSQIVQVLTNSPGLRKLKLSLSTPTIARYDHEDDRENFDEFFDELCGDYKAAAAPLRLQSLHLGTAVYPFEQSSVMALTDLQCLKEVHLENRGVWEGSTIIDMYGAVEGGSNIAFDAFGPLYCPNLRRINFADYQRDVHEFLARMEEPSFLNRLAVSCQGMWAGYEPAALLRPDPDFPSLPRHLRMLDIDLQRNQVRLCDEDGDDLEQEDIPATKEILADLVSGDTGTLEGLTVHLPENLEALGGFEDFGLLLHSLSSLANLTQLAVEANIHGERLVKGDALEDAARLLAAAAPRLRYVKVYDECWRVWREGGGRRATLRLERLEDREINEVELFRGLIWEPQAC